MRHGAWVFVAYVSSALLGSLLVWAFGGVDTWPGGLALAAVACLGIPITEATVALWRALRQRDQRTSP